MDNGQERKIIPFRNPARERRRLMIFAGVLLGTALLLAFFLMDGGKNLDTLNRMLRYRGGGETIALESGEGNVFCAVDNRLATAGLEGLQVYNRDGSLQAAAATSLQNPMLRSGGDYAAAWDAGTAGLLLIHKSRGVQDFSAPEGMLLDVDLSSDGYMCALSAGAKAKAVLQMYNRQCSVGYTVYSSSRYLALCAAAPGGGRCAAVALGEQEHVFESTLVIYRTDREKPEAELSLGSQLIYDIFFLNSKTVCAVGETELIFSTSSGQLLGTYTYTGTLTRFAAGKDFVLLAMSSSQSGSGWDVISVGRDGKELARQSFAQEVTGLSAAGKYSAVLTAQSLQIGGSRLQAWYSADQVSGAASVIQCPDGSALLAGGQRVWRIVP